MSKSCKRQTMEMEMEIEFDLEKEIAKEREKDRLAEKLMVCEELKMQYSSIESVVNNPICTGYFLQLCRSQFSSENINFVTEVDRFRDMFEVDKDMWKSPYRDIDYEVEREEISCSRSVAFAWRSSVDLDVVQDRMNKIVDNYISDDAPHQVCLSREYIKNTMRRIKSVDLYGPKVFDEAIIDSLKTLKRDLLPRFLRSILFDKMIDNLSDCDPLPSGSELVVPPPDKYVLRINPVSYFTDDRAFSLAQLLQGQVLYTNFRWFLEKNFCSENAISVRMIDHFEELMLAGNSLSVSLSVSLFLCLSVSLYLCFSLSLTLLFIFFSLSLTL
jgi:hypothetical protein